MNFPLTLTIADRQSMDSELDAAVTAAKAQALAEKRHGILVTRHGVDTFTVALSEAVPFGLTREHQAW
jgi:F420-0:gamma-glutamyl ligase